MVGDWFGPEAHPRQPQELSEAGWRLWRKLVNRELDWEVPFLFPLNFPRRFTFLRTALFAAANSRLQEPPCPGSNLPMPSPREHTHEFVC